MKIRKTRENCLFLKLVAKVNNKFHLKCHVHTFYAATVTRVEDQINKHIFLPASLLLIFSLNSFLIAAYFYNIAFKIMKINCLACTFVKLI